MVSPSDLDQLDRNLTEKNLTYSVKVQDIQSLIEQEKKDNPVPLSPRLVSLENFNLAQYHTVTEIDEYVARVNEVYPNSSELIYAGTSYEGRPIYALKMGIPSSTPKPVIFMDAGIHAREWISPATALYFINQLVVNNSSKSQELLRQYDWYIIPVANPDGYAYSWTYNRMWRKNRKPNSLFSVCTGIDLNRNFDVGPLENKVSPCAPSYGGTKRFSEPETQAIRNLAEGLKDRIFMALSLHSISQFIFAPYFYQSKSPSNFQLISDVSHAGLAALRAVHGSSYRFGSAGKISYPASGTSADWYYEKLGVKYAVIIELRDRGQYGFLLPKDQIIPTGEETWAFVKTAVKKLKEITAVHQDQPNEDQANENQASEDQATEDQANENQATEDQANKNQTSEDQASKTQ